MPFKNRTTVVVNSPHELFRFDYIVCSTLLVLCF